MIRPVIALVAGAVFAWGLTLSGMTDTRKVQGFLDVTGNWDPTLAFVMGGAMLPMALAWWFLARRVTSLTGSNLPAPATGSVDRSLLVGAALFGAGWGLIGFCPGPALASLATGETAPLVFVAAMLAGMWLTGLGFVRRFGL